MKQITIIGDVHGKTKQFFDICNKVQTDIIQLGDFGFYEEYLQLIEFAETFPFDIYIVQGNHDYRGKLPELPDNLCILNDYGCIYNNKIGYVSGAFSIDKSRRTEGIDWFNDEELSISDLNNASYYFETLCPKLMITHSVPTSIVPKLLHKHSSIKSRTQQGLQGIYEHYVPNLWLCGHFHRKSMGILCGTK